MLGTAIAQLSVASSVALGVPVAGWALKGAVAYAGTRALGEAARRYFATQQQAEASRAAS